jgi:hypothetical protein
MKLVPSKRDIKFFFQRVYRGWDDSETWSLDSSLAKIVLPRLKRFRELYGGRPARLTTEEWANIIDEMIFAFEFHTSEERWCCTDKDKWNRVNNGLELFGKYYSHLWY